MRATCAVVVGAVLALAQAARGDPPARRGVGYGWLTFPSGESVRKVREGPELDASGSAIGAGLVYAVPAGENPFDPGVVRAVRGYLASKYASARRLTLAAWVMTPQGTGVGSVQYRVLARRPDGRWDSDAGSVGFTAPADDVALPPTPPPRDPRAEDAGRAAMETWLSALDRRDFGACWRAASAEFREGFTEETWTAKLAELAGRLGARRRRRELAREYGPLRGEQRMFVTIEYRSAYTKERDVLEGVTAAPCGSRAWCVMGWGTRR